jgi:hypothetical protein
MLLVPPTLDASPRTIGLRRWHIRGLVLTAFGIICAALFAGTALGSRMYENQLTMMSDELGNADLRITAMGDTLRALRIVDFERTYAAAEALNRAEALPKSREGARLPVVGHISSRFSYSRPHPILHIRRPHLGIDIAAPEGTPVTAPATGRVIKVARSLSYGLRVEIDHGNGIVTRYAHLKSALVKEGQDVIAGTMLGRVGSSGLSTGPHLHYEVRRNGRPIDPLTYVINRPPRTPVDSVTPPPVRMAPVPAGTDPNRASE